MQISDIKRSLFGFKTDDVYKCFVEICKEYDDKQKETVDEYEKQIAELKNQNSSMQSTISALEEENKRLMANESVIANSVIDAKMFAEKIKTDTEAQATKLRQELIEQYLMGKEEAEKVLISVANCRKAIAEQLESIKGVLESTEVHVQSVIDKESQNIDKVEQSSKSNPLSLFVLNKGE